MSSRCEVVVYFYQEDEDLEVFKEGLQKIEDFYSGVWNWEWMPDIELDELDEYDEYQVWTFCKDHVGRIFEDKDQKLTEIMKEYKIASKWKGSSQYPITGSMIETDYNGNVGEERAYSFENAVYDETGNPIEYTEDDFDLFLSNMKKSLDGDWTEKDYFGDLEEYIDYLMEIFGDNYEDPDALHEALAGWNEEEVWPNWE